MHEATVLNPTFQRLTISKEVIPLSYDWLIGQLKTYFSILPETRQGKNTQYSIYDAAASAFSIFFMQQPSFLAYQRQMQEQQGQNNAVSLFGAGCIPSDNQTRNILDLINPSKFTPIFQVIFEALMEHKALESMRTVNQTFLIPLDGVQYFSSNDIHCKQCSVREHKDGHISYSHQAILPCLVAPNCDTIISLAPAFIAPQDGDKKQDCELKCAKRWLEQYGESIIPLGVTFLGDDLYAHQPFCEEILSRKGHFIFTAKEDSHKVMYEWVNEIKSIGKDQKLTRERQNGKKKFEDTYRFINAIPLRNGEDALLVNWCELVITQEGKVIARHAFITDHLITANNVAELIDSGRARWKTENENHNILKNHGYHITHNYGHGKDYLSQTLLTLNILAFLTHTILQQFDEVYVAVRKKLVRRDKFFQSIQVLTQFFYFNNWQHLIHFMAQQLELSFPVDAFVNTT